MRTLETPGSRFGILPMAALVATSLTACAPAPLEFPDWMVPVPEGTRVVEYPAVPPEDRTERIELVEDLVIGRDSQDPNYIFYQPNEVVVGPGGRIFVLDYGNNRIQVFDPAGQYLVSIGQAGEGPGEFQSPSAMAIVGDRLLVNDSPNAQLSSWSLEGEFFESVRPDPPLETGTMLGYPDGTLVYLDLDMSAGFSAATSVVERLASDGGPALRYEEAPIAGAFLANRTYRGAPIFINIPLPALSIAADARQRLFVAACAEYQIHTFALDGTIEWALRVPWDRQPIPEELFNSKVERLKKRLASLKRSDWDDPGDYPALEAIRIDGHGPFRTSGRPAVEKLTQLSVEKLTQLVAEKLTQLVAETTTRPGAQASTSAASMSAPSISTPWTESGSSQG